MRLLNAQSFYPEGPLQLGGDILYTEYSRDRVLRHDGTRNVLVWEQAGAGPCALIPDQTGNLLACCYAANAVIRLTPDGRRIESIDRDIDGRAFSGPNDITTDGGGGHYFTSSGVFDLAAPRDGRVYHLTADGRARLIAAGIHFANGLAFDPARRRLLVNAHLAGEVLAFDAAPDGSLGAARRFQKLPLPPQVPPAAAGYVGGDGMKIDPQGRIINAQFGGGRLLISDAAGEVLGQIDIPVPYVTNVNFTADPDRLVVTAMSDGWNAPFPGLVGLVSLADMRPPVPS